MKKSLFLFVLSGFIVASCVSSGGSHSQSSTEKRIKKQQKHRKKHDCPQLDC